MGKENCGKFIKKYSIEWVKLPFKEKIKYERSGIKEGKSGFEIFITKMSKLDEEKEEKDRQKFYEKEKQCSECKNFSLLHMGESIFVCDVCGEIRLEK